MTDEVSPPWVVYKQYSLSFLSRTLLMTTTDEWAAFLSGNYQGRMRPPAGEWEDLIGSIKLIFTAAGEGCLNVTITSLEFGTWVGSLRRPDPVMKGPTGQGDTYFECAFQERGQTEEIQGCFLGGIFAPPAERLFELYLASEWRKRRPNQGETWGRS